MKHSQYLISTLVLVSILSGCGASTPQGESPVLNTTQGSGSIVRGSDEDTRAPQGGVKTGKETTLVDQSGKSSLSGAPVEFILQVSDRELQVGDKEVVNILVSSKDPIASVSARLETSNNIRIVSASYDTVNFPDQSSQTISANKLNVLFSLGNVLGIQGIHFSIAKVEIEAIAAGKADVTIGNDSNVTARNGSNITPAVHPTVEVRVE